MRYSISIFTEMKLVKVKIVSDIRYFGTFTVEEETNSVHDMKYSCRSVFDEVDISLFKAQKSPKCPWKH